MVSIPPGHRGELADVFKRHADDIYRYLLLLTRGDHRLSEEMVQEAFVALALCWHEARTWPEHRQVARLKVMARNKAIDHFRRAEVERRHLPKLHDPAQVHDPAELTLAAYEAGQYWNEIRGLPPQQH